MDKLVMLSIIFAVVIAPSIGARMASPRRGLAWSLVAVAVCVIVYTIMLLFVASRLINTTLPPGFYFY